MRWSRLLRNLANATAILAAWQVGGAVDAQDKDAPRFNRDIRPILSDRCFPCHGHDPGNRKAELRLDTPEGATEWAIIPGDAENSEVITRVSSDDPEYRMPPRDSKKRPLTAEQVELIRRWIDAGAEYEPHWAYIPPKKPAVPEISDVVVPAISDVAAGLPTKVVAGLPTKVVAGLPSKVVAGLPTEPFPRPQVSPGHEQGDLRSSHVRGPETRAQLREWCRNDIDRFLLAKQVEQGIEPAGEADRVTLVRRLYFDLTGLPPTPAEVDEFLQNERPDAYERLVDKLLASPAYGERMASWWFDLVRFADTVGYHGDQDHRIAPYRDYVIKSFNDNLPFDQFTIEQLAGDLLPNPTMWQLVATGYNRVLQTTHEGGAQDAEYRAKHLADRVRNFSEVWLAASVGCAECHDHKFDPFTQRDFYSLGAFFADVDHYGSFQPVGGNSTPTERPPEMLAWSLPVYEEAQTLDKKIAKLESSLDGLFKGKWQERRDRLIELKKKRVELERKFVPTMITKATTPREVRILPRGNWLDQSGEIVQPQVPHFFEPLVSVVAGLPPNVVAGLPTEPRSRPQVSSSDHAGDLRSSTVRGQETRAQQARPETRAQQGGQETGGEQVRLTRLDLARWLVDGKNPLTARVVVNRLWYRYYGVGLSKSLLDLGSQGEWPQQPDLLDWLAVEFMDSGWDVKHMVRLMVTASAYRQSSLPRPEVEAVDPDNRLVARQSRYRLDAEQIRDNALAVSGLLVRKIGGGYAKPYQPAGYYRHLNFPEREYKPSNDEDQFRRAVYVHWQRQFLHPWLLAFDAPTREECTAQRAISNTPSAALVLLNDPSFVEAARALAARVLTESAAADDQARLRWAWRTVLARDPRSEELELLRDLLENHRRQFTSDIKAAEAVVSVGISKRPADVPTSELAAWTSVSRALLNLNETIYRN
jgi:hypothetical protein